MSQPHLLVVQRYPDNDMEQLAQHYTLHVLSDSASPERLLAEVAPHVRAVATNGEAGASAALIDALPHLEIVVCYGVGVDAIDLARARERGIRVTNTPDVLTGDVADMGLALLLALARQIPAADAYVRRGDWPRAPLPLTRRVFGARLGIVGLGRVGRALAKRCAGFEMDIAYHDRVAFDDVPYRHCGSVVELAARSDYLVVCAAADAGNRSLIGADVFDALGRDGMLVNVARGSIVDEPALLRYLRDRRIAGAALDVFWNEPNIDPAFFALDNVVLQPHRSSATIETRAAMADLVRANLRAFFAGEPLVTEYRIAA
ncbi:2-hydroxyacid dehydrogenase [Paraburkholderia caballeronis]|uniref:Lactate dehydrogenase n=1 Tax=Paraburkholderia caballeronis TaxID=416943 RepID=A0A1H7P6W7_9BURK|nr:2-hydroxyacid dehydrogenase [Paraburkholderia caballeronis]PXW25380.1 lactate dehydrogenase-like 2-hydroxyacid dehydrogenase [Paraburkholderia caballeronis]PXX00987.1 lactate dehydrogenase-like 2-hydroxyacid dehydrogenase [Paraburkholderia caballeronis]RAJ99660.1 lactate dehydrogenase-like 2-hydroxyacid dehydrogenase [Paraburkholderia caballeronis]SEE39716.1 Lactate dehydrogenase [Paraburkholderia caballeronis]SEL30817.1 Lactate dehydrogenase [Paraburkholderia caballeronis]